MTSFKKKISFLSYCFVCEKRLQNTIRNFESRVLVYKLLFMIAFYEKSNNVMLKS